MYLLDRDMDISGRARRRVDVQLQAGHWCYHKICYRLLSNQVTCSISLFSKCQIFMSRDAWSNALEQQISLIHTVDGRSGCYIHIYNLPH
jgi:hypothetical protein